MFRNYLVILILLLISTNALAEITMDPWEFLGAQDSQLNGICSSGHYLFATTHEGLHFYNFQTEQWTDRTWPGWIGKGKYAAVAGQMHEQRLVTGGVNAWFKGTLFFSDDMGETESLVRESEGGRVTDLGASIFVEPTLYACTWSDVVDGEFLRSDDDGETWSLILGHGHHTMTDLEVLGHQEVFLAGDNYVAHTTDGGLNWQNLQGNLPVGEGIYCMLAQPAMTSLPSPEKDKTDAADLMASNDTGLFLYDFDTGLWEMILPDSCRSIAQRFCYEGLFICWTETYAVTWDGRIMATMNGDWENWQDITGDLIPGTPIDVETNGWGVFVAMQGGGVFHSQGMQPLSDVPGLASNLEIKAFPNPFNPATTIKFETPVAGRALLQVFDVRGALVETLFEGEVEAGTHSHQWRPQGLGSGVYRTVLQIEGQAVHGSVVLLK